MSIKFESIRYFKHGKKILAYKLVNCATTEQLKVKHFKELAYIQERKQYFLFLYLFCEHSILQKATNIWPLINGTTTSLLEIVFSLHYIHHPL